MLAFVALFLTIPLSTLPGMFNFVGVLLGLITVGIIVLMILSVVSNRSASK